MGNKTKRTALRGKKKGRKQSNKPGDISVEELNELIAAAEEAFNEANLEESKRLYVQAIGFQPDNTKLLDGLAVVDLQLGEVEEAMGLLRSSIALAPTDNPAKWFYYAQLHSNKEALQYYEQGIAILQQQIVQVAEAETRKTMSEQICDAYCAIAELFMTDLCFEENAETMCETAITHALQAVPNNLSALQTMASFRISQCRPEDACIILENLVNIVNQQLQQYTNRKITDELLNANSIDSSVPPTIEFLISFCKLLIECSCHREKFSVDANSLLEQMLDLDDENPEIWYLLGFNEENKPNQPDIEAAKEYYESGKQMIEKIIQADPLAREAFQDFLQIFEKCLQDLQNPQNKQQSIEKSSTLLNAFSRSKANRMNDVQMQDMEEEEEQWEDEMET